jgi:hypothetical protein
MKLFTVEEANALIPVVRRRAERIQRAYRQIAARREEAQAAAAQALRGGGGMAHGAEYIGALQKLSAAVGELEALGVQLKDYERGLIDFPTRREDRIVLLCWQLGEGDKIEWWHELEAGFAGRQPL